MENIKQSQLEMARNHNHGATGVVVSGVMWLMAGLVAYGSPKQAVSFIQSAPCLIKSWERGKPKVKQTP